VGEGDSPAGVGEGPLLAVGCDVAAASAVGELVFVWLSRAPTVAVVVAGAIGGVAPQPAATNSITSTTIGDALRESVA
jgi:hypothetical protein